MRNRIIEILAAVIGVAVVVALYSDRTWFGELEAPAQSPAMIEEESADVIRMPPPVAPVAAAAVDPEPVVRQPAVDDAEVAEALQDWEAARQTLEVVEAQLDELDSVFDSKEEEFAELEAQGTDPAMLEDEMLIFLDRIVEQYDELETRLAEAAAEEMAAAERLATLRGDFPEALDQEGRH